MRSLAELSAIQKGLLPEAMEKRDQRRKRVVMAGLLVQDESTRGLDCTIYDISENGARIGFARDVPLTGTVHLLNMRERMVHVADIAWRRDLQMGLSFQASFSLSGIADPKLTFLKRLWLERTTR